MPLAQPVLPIEQKQTVQPISSILKEYQNQQKPTANSQHTTKTAAFRELCSFGFTGETYYDYDKGLDPDDPILIIHFNDVYNIEPPTEGIGGISRFVSALRQFADSNPLILFSGDAFNPSFLSTFTKGRHMVPFLNILKIHTACVGNHDLDFGIDDLEYLTGSTRFPWLLSNVFDAYCPARPLGGANMYRLFEWQGHRVGVIGLVEQEWIKTLSEINEEDIIYKDYVKAADELSVMLRLKECELIIALTHMRAPNDERLAREAKDLDLILGGHDHEYFGAMRIHDTIVCKSGTDFRQFTTLTIFPGVKTSLRLTTSHEHDDVSPPVCCVTDFSKLPFGVFTPRPNCTGGAYLMPKFCNGSVLEWNCITVSPDVFHTNRHVDKLVSKYLGTLEKHMDKVLGENGVYLETRFSIIRTQEANVGNWLADLLRVNTKSDIAFFNSGTVRSDCLYPPGLIRVRDLVTMLPMPDELIVIQITGQQLRETLENSVNQYPKTEGRFLQISGFHFKFDGSKPPGQRVISIEIQCYDNKSGSFTFRPLDLNETFNACTKSYLWQGKDGFEMLKNLPVIFDEEDCPNLQTLVRNSFSLAAMASGVRKPRNISTLKRVDTFKAMNLKEQTLSYGMTPNSETGMYKLNCTVEGRIINLQTMNNETK